MGQLIMLADISSRRSLIISARPSPPHFYWYITDRLLFLYIFNTIVRLSIVSMFIHVYFLVKPLESIF